MFEIKLDHIFAPQKAFCKLQHQPSNTKRFIPSILDRILPCHKKPSYEINKPLNSILPPNYFSKHFTVFLAGGHFRHTSSTIFWDLCVPFLS